MASDAKRGSTPGALWGREGVGAGGGAPGVGEEAATWRTTGKKRNYSSMLGHLSYSTSCNCKPEESVPGSVCNHGRDLIKVQEWPGFSVL